MAGRLVVKTRVADATPGLAHDVSGQHLLYVAVAKHPARNRSRPRLDRRLRWIDPPLDLHVEGAHHEIEPLLLVARFHGGIHRLHDGLAVRRSNRHLRTSAASKSESQQHKQRARRRNNLQRSTHWCLLNCFHLRTSNFVLLELRLPGSSSAAPDTHTVIAGADSNRVYKQRRCATFGWDLSLDDLVAVDYVVS